MIGRGPSTVLEQVRGTPPPPPPCSTNLHPLFLGHLIALFLIERAALTHLVQLIHIRNRVCALPCLVIEGMHDQVPSEEGLPGADAQTCVSVCAIVMAKKHNRGQE